MKLTLIFFSEIRRVPRSNGVPRKKEFIHITVEALLYPMAARQWLRDTEYVDLLRFDFDNCFMYQQWQFKMPHQDNDYNEISLDDFVLG